MPSSACETTQTAWTRPTPLSAARKLGSTLQGADTAQLARHKLQRRLLRRSSRLAREEFLFFNDTATPEIYTLSLHDALPVYSRGSEIYASSSDRASVGRSLPLQQ